jgi:hypothetical protein
MKRTEAFHSLNVNQVQDGLSLQSLVNNDVTRLNKALYMLRISEFAISKIAVHESHGFIEPLVICISTHNCFNFKKKPPLFTKTNGKIGTKCNLFWDAGTDP